LDNHKLRDSFTWNLNEQLITPEDFADILCDDIDIPAATFSPLIAGSIRSQLQEYESMAAIELPEDDCRVVIQLDLQLGKQNLRDRFEWDLSSDLTPEEFSRNLSADLGVGGEFVPMIAHSIHEQLLRHKKEKLDDNDNHTVALTSAFRNMDDVNDWSPALEMLTTEELEKLVLDKERSIRRLRRETSRFSIGRRQRSSQAR